MNRKNAQKILKHIVQYVFLTLSSSPLNLLTLTVLTLKPKTSPKSKYSAHTNMSKGLFLHNVLHCSKSKALHYSARDVSFYAKIIYKSRINSQHLWDSEGVWGTCGDYFLSNWFRQNSQRMNAILIDMHDTNANYS